MDSDSDEPLAATIKCASCALVMPRGSSFCPKCGWTKFGAAPASPWAKVTSTFFGYVVLAIVAGICYGASAGIIWVKEQFFDGAEAVGKRAAKCWDDAKRDESLGTKCVDLYLRAKALEQREHAEQFCKDKGLRFKGTIGDQTECEP